MNIDLSHKNALVGGGSKGIGKAIAIELASLGATVTLIARNEDELQSAIKELDNQSGQKHDFIVLDYSHPGIVKEKVEEYLVDTEKTFHILINNTGGPPGGAIIDADEQEFRQAFNNHLVCNHILAKLLLPGMKATKYGRIINVISTSVKQPLSGLGVSNTIRAAVANWSKTFSNEVGQFGITVNNILPGATNTERLTSIIKSKAEKSGKTIQAIEEKMRSAIPMQRFAEPKEVGAAAAFLASPAASYINGINLPVDGGRTGSL